LASAKQIAEAAAATLHVVTASAVVGKYIGETEKNLAALFQKAEQNDSILFFDEADALFGKRTEVKDAHDRYANDAASTMPKRLLAYSGLVVLGMRRTDAMPIDVERFADAVVTNRQKPAKKVRKLPWRTLCRVKRAK
jgi:SpoVK/Ycf46/Vps4 family AAA+-type ATPase